MNSKRRLLVWLAGLFALLLWLSWLLPALGFLTWSPINCWGYDVDICSGRIRYTRYFAFVAVARRVQSSALSDALEAEDFQGCRTEWRRVLTFSPGVRHSPHYVFHGAIHQIHELESTWELGFTLEARRASALRVLDLWREGDCDDAARDYLRELFEIAYSAYDLGHKTDVADLPPESPAVASEQGESAASE